MRAKLAVVHELFHHSPHATENQGGGLKCIDAVLEGPMRPMDPMRKQCPTVALSHNLTRQAFGNDCHVFAGDRTLGNHREVDTREVGTCNWRSSD